MLNPLILRIALFGWLLFGSLLGVAHGAGNTLTIGSISADPAKEIHHFMPFVRYLAAQLAPQGITTGEVVVTTTMREMADRVKSGQVDLYIDSPLPSLLINHLAASKMVLRRWKKGKAEYGSVIFVKKDAPIQDLSQLSGKLIGFKDPYSSSSYLLPRLAVEQAGLNLVKIANVQDKIPEGKVGYLFTNDRENNLFWVLMGKTAAGAMSREELTKQAKGDMEKLRIIHETKTIPRHVMNLRGNLPAPLSLALTQALLTMDQNETGKQILAAFEETTRFDLLPPDSLAQLQEMAPAILAILDSP